MIIGNKVNIHQIFEEVLMVELRVISKEVWLLWVGTGMNVLSILLIIVDM